MVPLTPYPLASRADEPADAGPYQPACGQQEHQRGTVLPMSTPPPPPEPGSSGGNPPPETIAAARNLVDQLRQEDAATALWGALQKALMAAGVPPRDIMPLIMGRHLDGVDTLLATLAGDAPAPDPEPMESAPEIPDSTLRAAMKAFRRRLKLTKLDHESRLGVGPLTGGKAADFDSILPPHEFPQEVWKALAQDGQLVSTGRGFYKLPE